MHHRSLSVFALVLAIGVVAVVVADSGGEQAAQTAKPVQIDRTYTLEATMVGYRGVGGEIDGVRNPVLWARTGEMVRITIMNGELMVHDIALDKLGVKSAQILDKGATTSITFRAEQSDTYFCSVPGHRLAGMEGRLDVTDEPRTRSEGVPPAGNGRPLNLDFETGTARRLERDRRRVRDRERRRHAERISGGLLGQQPGRRQCAQGHALVVSRSASPIRTPASSCRAARSASTRVELVLVEGDKVIYTITGADQAALRPAVADLRPYADREMYVRLVDDETGASTATYIREHPWAHLSFDHFRFHATRPFFAAEIRPSDITTLPPMDPVPHAGLSGADAARAMRLPAGLLGEARRVGAGCGAADRVHARRSRPVVGR